MYIVYQLGVYFYYLFILFASLFNRKAALWINGRKSQAALFKTPLTPAKRIWFHFASLGEFEQGRSVLEKIHQQHPNYKIVISFFSPSGYEIRKNYSLAEKVYYLPLDTPSNAKVFLSHINPEIIVFNKYEYWFHYFNVAKKRNIPLFIISSIFRKDQLFFKSYGTFQRSILKLVRCFFVQNAESKKLLSSININNCIIAGDTRFDRVYEHSLNPIEDKCIQDFSSNGNIFVAGSSWPKDEELILALSKSITSLKFIIVPHEVNSNTISSLKKLFGNQAGLYSELKNTTIPTTINVLIVDTVGLLNSIYKHAKYTYIGGGFGVGIHNTLEAAAYGKPIFFGPNYHKFSEAKDLIANGAAKSISTALELTQRIKHLENNLSEYQFACNTAKQYVYNQKGATDIILTYLEKEKYLA